MPRNRKGKKNGKFWCEIKIVCTRKNIFPNHGIMWEAIEQPRRSFPWSWTLYRLGMTNWLGRLIFRLANWAFNDLSSFCRVWTWVTWAWNTSLLSALCSFFLTFLLELPLVGKAWMKGWGALAFGWRRTEDVDRFCRGNRSYFRSGNLAKQIAS